MNNTNYKVAINMTGKATGRNNDDFQLFDTQIVEFATLEEVKEYLKENYKGKKREKIYRDTSENKAVHIGYIYKMGINQDMSHMSNKWYEQHWVEVTKVMSYTMIVEAK